MEEVLAQICTSFAGGEARRLLHGRGGCFAGFEYMSVDYFKPVILISLYRRCELGLIRGLAAAIRQRLPEIEGVLVQTRDGSKVALEVVWGRMPKEVWAFEEGLHFRVNFERGQNIGFFLDMRCARAWLRRHAAGKRVLNLFAYTCSFSVAALASGARQVLNVDMNRRSLEIGRENHRRNGLDMRAAGFLKHEVFRSLGKLKKLGPWDLIVIDPPTRQPGSFEVGRDYPRLLRHLPQLAAPKALVLACLNDPGLDGEILKGWFADKMAGAKLLERLEPPPEFCEVDRERGLKTLVFQCC